MGKAAKRAKHAAANGGFSFEVKPNPASRRAETRFKASFIGPMLRDPDETGMPQWFAASVLVANRKEAKQWFDEWVAETRRYIESEGVALAS